MLNPSSSSFSRSMLPPLPACLPLPHSAIAAAGWQQQMPASNLTICQEFRLFSARLLAWITRAGGGMHAVHTRKGNWVCYDGEVERSLRIGESNNARLKASWHVNVILFDSSCPIQSVSHDITLFPMRLRVGHPLICPSLLRPS